jgi:beta-aspartyl-peptidase (threonine type)
VEFWERDIMKAMTSTLIVVIVLLSLRAAWADGDASKPILVVHGGAGVYPRQMMTAELEKQYRADMERALHAGDAILSRGGRSVDAVEAALRVFEDSPLFNAGKGAVFTREGRNELDAAIMDGKDKRAGAVAGITRIKNPISAARAVMEKSGHALLVGEGADRFAKSCGLEEVSPVYFWTPRAWQELAGQLQAEQKKREKGLNWIAPPGAPYGTAGAVALDQAGNLAAGTSTGGLNAKRPGRVGAAPIIGAGTYADDLCAVSGTGHGDIFMRYTVAHEIAARMRYRGQSVQQAAAEVLGQLPNDPGGVGGLIGLDRYGHFATPFNTPAMLRGWIQNGKAHVAIYDK